MAQSHRVYILDLIFMCLTRCQGDPYVKLACLGGDGCTLVRLDTKHPVYKEAYVGECPVVYPYPFYDPCV